MKSSGKKTAKTVQPQHIGLVKNDGYLAPYEEAIRGRHDHVLWKLSQLTANGKKKLADFASGYDTMVCTRPVEDGCSENGPLMPQISTSWATSTTGRKQRSSVALEWKEQETGN